MNVPAKTTPAPAIQGARHTEEVKVRTSGRAAMTLGIISALGLFGLGGFWVATAQLAGAVVAPGTLAIEGNAKNVQHPEGGVVKSINVAIGDPVSQGDILIEMDDSLLRSNAVIFEDRLRELVATRSRLNAQRKGQKTIEFEGKLLETLGVDIDEDVQATQLRIFETELAQLNGRSEQLDQRIEQFGNQIIGLQAQREAIAEQIVELEAELEALQALDTQGLTAQRPLREARRQIANLTGQRGGLLSEEARVANSVAEAKIEVLQIERDFLRDATTNLAQVDLQIRETTEQLLSTRVRLGRAEVRAPVDGLVHQLEVFTVGGVVGAGDILMQIIPQTSDLDVQVPIEPQYIDSLYIGQPAGVRLSAFNQSTTPELEGEIVSISPSTTRDAVTGLVQYEVRARIPPTELAKISDLRLLPGMPAEVFVQTQERTPLNYLLRPLTDQITRAFREE